MSERSEGIRKFYHTQHPPDALTDEERKAWWDCFDLECQVEHELFMEQCWRESPGYSESRERELR